MKNGNFQARARSIVDKHLSNPNFDVALFAEELGISRMHLHRQLKKMTQQTSSEYIRSIRLSRAAELLIQEKSSVQEIMHQVGFRNCSYFAKCFRKKFGQAPSQFKSNPPPDLIR